MARRANGTSGRGAARGRGKAPATRRAAGGRGWRAGAGRALLGIGLRMAVVALLFLAGLTVWLDFKVRAEFEGQRWAVPARLYARPLSLYAEQSMARAQILAELEAAGYRRVGAPTRPGEFSASEARIDVHTRAFQFWDGIEPARQVSVMLRDRHVSALRSDGEPLALLRLEPALVARIYPTDNEDRVLKRLGELPAELVAGLITVEDRQFLTHRGISLRGIVRAAFANLLAGSTVQGGSTLTQQLAKNFFLSAERTLWRKVREAIIAVILEVRYDKETILEAYLNEIYMGQQGPNAIHGFGSAATFYFGRPVEELQLHESALLIALARGASYYNPRRNPERALERRNLVLDLMAEHGVVAAARAAAAAARPLGVAVGTPAASTAHPAFVELVREQLRRDYQEQDLRSEGLRIFTTLEPSTQLAAEQALGARLTRIEAERKLPAGELQGAVVVVEPAGGQVLAVVGDREPRAQGFNRALNARRPIGSLVKAAVYLTALESGYRLDSALLDATLQVALPTGRSWSPSNYDGEVNGEVSLREALARSLNLATVRLGMDLGVPRVASTLRALGVTATINPVPSLLLGTVELTPLEVAELYQPLAAGGFKVPIRAIREVTDAGGQPLRRYPLEVKQVADGQAVMELREGLVAVFESGTARGVRAQLPATLRVAGKTGTTDDLRDSWFAGFGADRLAVVWVGRDDNQPARLTGSSGALRVWADLMQAVPPRSLPSASAPLRMAATDGMSGRDGRDASPASDRGSGGGCEGDLLGGFLQSLLGSGCDDAPPPVPGPTAPGGPERGLDR